MARGIDCSSEINEWPERIRQRGEPVEEKKIVQKSTKGTWGNEAKRTRRRENGRSLNSHPWEGNGLPFEK